MDNKPQPVALKLAEMLPANEWLGHETLVSYARECVAELLTQHARITELESQLAQRFDAADMATAAAQGFRDGVASLSANAGEPRNAIARDALIDAIAQGMHGTWHCTRVWEAWHVGTMSQDDFEPVDESETPTEIADAVLALLAAPPAAQATQQAVATGECMGPRCMASSANGYAHSRECIDEAAETQGWTPTADDYAKCGPSAPQPSPTAQSAESVPALDRDRIREIFMAHGFTVKEGQTDLKQYVYDAADALLRAARAQADSVQKDAACWHWLAEYLVGTRTDLDDELVACETVDDMRKLVKAAIKQGANHDR